MSKMLSPLSAQAQGEMKKNLAANGSTMKADDNMSDEVLPDPSRSLAALTLDEAVPHDKDIKTSEVTESKSTPRHSLPTLPIIVIERILDYLLTAADVKITGDDFDGYSHWFGPDYKFSTAILRVNKDLRALGARIFERNHFALCSTKDTGFMDKIGQDLSLHRIWHRHKAITPFKNYHLRLHISSTTYRVPDKGDQMFFFLMPMYNLKDLVWVMRLQAAVSVTTYKFIFDIKKQSNGNFLSESVQDKLLKPFTKLLSIGQGATIRGGVHDSIMAKYQDALRPSLLWRRGQYWEFLDCVKFKVNAARGFCVAGYIMSGLRTYMDVMILLDKTTNFGSEASEYDDKSITIQYDRLRCRTISNMCMLFFDYTLPLTPVLVPAMRPSLVRVFRDTPNNIFEPPHVSTTVAAMLKLHLGFTLLVLDEADEGLRSIDKAAQCPNPEVAYIKDIAAKCKSWNDQRNRGINADDLLEEIRVEISVSMFNMPAETKMMHRGLGPTVSSIDYERHVLRGLGYTGDLLEGRVEQREGWSVDLVHGEEAAKPFSIKDAEATIIRLRRRLNEIRNRNEKPASLMWGIEQDPETGEFREYLYGGTELRPPPFDLNTFGMVFGGIGVDLEFEPWI